MPRLPSVGGDNGQWGQILNDFLSVEHNPDGTLKKAGDIASAQTDATQALSDAAAAASAANSANTAAQNAQSTANSKYTKPNSGIPESDLDASVQSKLSAAQTGTPDASTTTKGKLQLAGDLTGTASSPQITAGAVTDAKIAIGANIGQSKIQNLPADLAAKYEKPGSGIPASDLTSSVQTAILQAGTAEQAANKGQAGGYASLDGGGKVPASQLPSAIMRYQGVWNASTNSPLLADGSGDAGDVYRVTTAGTQNLGSGSITFNVGDYAVYNPSGIWEKSDTTDSVASVAGKTGVVTLDKNDVGLNNVQNVDTTLRANHTGTQTASTISDFASAADARITAQKGAAGGVATLDGTGKIPGTQLPALAITNTFSVNSQAAQLALSAQEGDLAIRTDEGKTYVHNGGTAGTMADWSELLSIGDQSTANSKVSKSGDVMTGGLTLTNTATTGITLYNTTDQATNYERARMYWSSSILTLAAEYGGAGLARAINIQGGAGTAVTIDNGGSLNGAKVALTSSATGGPSPIRVINNGLTSSSILQSAFSVSTTVNQGGSAGYTALLINTTEMSTGSGTKNLIDAQTGGASRFTVDSVGNVTNTGTLYSQSSTTVGTGTTYTTSTIRGVDWSGLSIDVYSNAGSAGYNYFRKARGTIGSPSAVLSNDSLGYFGFRAHNGTSFNNQDSARLNAVATQDSGSSHGGALVFATASNGSLNTSGAAERMRIDHTGNVRLGNTAAISSKLTFDADTTAAGGILFGSDTNLYRSAPDVLTTDDAIQAASYMVAYNASNNQVAIGRTAGGTPGPGITFGTAQDTNLYRSGTDTLKTDDTFYASGELWTATHMSQRTVVTSNYNMSLFSGSIGNYPSFAPFGRFLWHDMLSFNLRWGTPAFERYNGTSWSSATLDTSIFALKEGNAVQIIDGTTYSAARWTWNNGNVPYSYPAWWMIGIPYSGATNPSKNILVETSADGVNWTTRHTSTGNTSNGYPIAFPVNDNGADGYIRLTITITNGAQLRISSMKALSARWGDQAGGQELNYPYQWDNQGRITIGAGSGGGVGTTVLSNGALNVGGSAPTTAAQGIYFGTDVSLYRHSASNLKTDGNMRVGNGLIAKDNAPEQVTVGYMSAGKGGLSIGVANDTNLYRDSADVLKTDDAFVIGSDRLNIATSKTPASASAAGTTGDIAWDANYVYVCVAANTWKRTPLSSW